MPRCARRHGADDTVMPPASNPPVAQANGLRMRLRAGGSVGPLAVRRAAIALMLLPQLGAFSKYFHLDSVCSLERRARIGPQDIVVDPSADGADGTHRLDGCIDFSVSGHTRLRWIRHTP